MYSSFVKRQQGEPGLQAAGHGESLFWRSYVCTELVSDVHLKRSRTAASLAPIYLFRTSGPFTLTNRRPEAATAAATACVFPHPGGPYSSAPVRRRNGALQ